MFPAQGITALAESGNIVVQDTVSMEDIIREEHKTVEESSGEAADSPDIPDGERIQETLPLEPLEDKTPLDGVTAIYWNPGGSLPAELSANPDAAAEATPSNSTEAALSDTGKAVITAATASNAGTDGNITPGSDRADGYSPERPVKTLETALKQADRLVEEYGLDKSDITIYAMNPMEIPDGRMYVLNAGNIRIASWPGRTYHNDTIFYVNGGQMTLMNVLLEPGSESADPDEAEVIRVKGGALQMGQNVLVEGRIVMDYRRSKEQTEWEKASASNAATPSDASANATASNWTEAGIQNAGFDIDNYILSTDENEWELLEDKAQASTWREPIIELIEGFDGVEEGYLLELRTDNNKNNVTLAKTLYADDVPADEFAGLFRLSDAAAGEWLLLPSSEKKAEVRDTGAEDLRKYYRSANLSTLEESEVSESDDSITAEAEKTAVMTVKTLSAAKDGNGTTIYWNPGPAFVYNGIDYPAGADSGYDGTTANAPVKTLAQAIAKANGGTIIVMQTLNLGDADAGDYLTTKDGDAWLVKAASEVVVPTLKVWEVNAQPAFRVPAGEKLILEDIELAGQTKDGRTVESQAIVVEAGGDLTIRSAVTAETGYIQVNAANNLKDYPIHADSTDAVSVVLFYAGINANLGYRYTDVVVPTTGLLPDDAGDQDRIDTGLALMDCYRLAKANSLEANGGTSQFDWVLRPDQMGDDLIETPQNLELYAPYYYDAVYLDGVRGDDASYGASCQYPVKTWERARAIWEEQMEFSIAARTAAKAANDDLTKEQIDKRYPYPGKIYICGTVTVDESGTPWELKPYTDYDGTEIVTEVTSHLDSAEKDDGSGLVHGLPQTLVEVTSGAELMLKNVHFRNNTDLSDSRTIRVTGAGSGLKLAGDTTMSGKLDAGYHQDAKEVTRGTHIEAQNGASVNLLPNWTGSVETRQQGITADGAGTTVLMNGGIIQKNNVYDSDVSTGDQKKGAGISLTNGASMTMNGGEISGNKTYYHGGGVYVEGTGTSFTMNAGKIVKNTVSYNGTKELLLSRGIGIYAGTGTVVNIGKDSGSVSDVKINENSNYLSEGTGIYSDGILTINRAEISDNQADSTGGGYYTSYSTSYMGKGVGIYVAGNGTLTMDGAKVSGNKVQKKTNGYEHGFGAGIYISGAKDHVIKNSEISENGMGVTRNNGSSGTGRAYSRGGGVYYYSSGGSLDISNTVIRGNHAGSGGGIQVHRDNNSSKINITDCTIEKNIASTASWDAASSAADGTGGGIFLYGSQSTMTIKDCEVRDNTAAAGGGIYASDGTIRMLGSSADKVRVTGNQGGGIYVHGSGYPYLYGENALIAQNNGYGIRMYSTAYVYLRKSRIIDNTTFGALLESGGCYFEDVRLENNGDTALNGGGVYIGTAEFYLSERTPGASALKGNRAANGGGIYQNGGKVILDISGAMKNSAASHGNNVYMKGGSMHILQGALKQPDEETDGIYNVYLDMSASTSNKFYIDPTKVKIEKRQGANPDAVYLNTGSSQVNYLQAPLTEDSAVMPIDTNTDVFKVGSVLVRPANLPSVTVFRPNDELIGKASYSVKYAQALQDASINMNYESGGRLPRRTQLGGFQDESNVNLTNVVLTGEGVYLAGQASGGDDTHGGTSPTDAVATFGRAKEVLENLVNEKYAAEKELPEESRQGYSPYIYICGNVPVTGNETWELDYGDTLFTDTNAAFEKAEKALEPDLDSNTLTPQVRRFASFLRQPMITAESGSSLRMEKIIVDGMCTAVDTSIQSSYSPIIKSAGSSTVTLAGEAQLRSNYSVGVEVSGKMILEGTENQPNEQLKNIEGSAVKMSADGAVVEMNGYSRIISDAVNAAMNINRYGIEVNSAKSHVIMKDHSAIQGSSLKKFYSGISAVFDQAARKIELQDFAEISYADRGIVLSGRNNIELHMNHGDNDAEDMDSAQIRNCDYGIFVDAYGADVYMGKQSALTQNGRGISVEGNSSASYKFNLEMSENSAITGNNSSGILLYRMGPVVIKMTDHARITRNGGNGIEESYYADAIEILMEKDARISANRSAGINLTGNNTANASWSGHKITMKDRAMIGGNSIYTASADVEDCGNAGYGIYTRGPAKVSLQDSAFIGGNTDYGFYFDRQNSGSYSSRTGDAELTLEGSSVVSNNRRGGIGVRSTTYNSTTRDTYPSALKATVKGNAAVYGNGESVGTSNRRQIYINLESSLNLQENARVSGITDTEAAIYSDGKVYMDGTAKVDGVIHLMTPILPITLQKAVRAGNQYNLYLAEGFLGKEVVIPDGVDVADASLYLSNYIKTGAAGLAAPKSLVADRPNIILEGENNVYLSGSGKDTNDGNSPATAVRTFHRARELLRTGRFSKGANIYICGGVVSITNWSDAGGSGVDDDWSFDGDGTVTNEKTGATWTPLVKRYQGYRDVMISVNNGQTLTLKNIVLDGNKETVSTYSSMIFATYGSTCVLGEGAVLQNNKASSSIPSGVYVNGGTLIMEGGIIQGMENKGASTSTDESAYASGVLCQNYSSSWPAAFYFKSGQIRNNMVTNINYSNGAAVVIDPDAKFVMTGGTISGNSNAITSTASGYRKYVRGAGVYVNSGRAEIKGGTIRDNTSNLGSAVYYTDSTTVRSDKRGVILSGGQISGNHVNSFDGASPYGLYSPIYVNGPNFQLEGGGCDISDSMYLNDIRNHIIVSGDIYQAGRSYLVSLNQGGGEFQFHKGSVVVAPDGNKKTDVTGYLPYFTVASNPYVLDRGQIAREIATGGNIQENQSLLLMQAVYLDGENGSDGSDGTTPKRAVKTFTKAKSIGESGIGAEAKDYYIIYICGKTANTQNESAWSMATPAYMCRYTGFVVYKQNGEPVDEINRAYNGYLVEPQSDLTLGRLAIYGRRSIDSQEFNGDSLIRIPAHVTVTVQADGDGEAVFGRNYNVGQYWGADGIQANLSSQGGAFQIAPEGVLKMSAGRIVEMDATYGSAIYLGADETGGSKTGHLILSQSPAISGTVYLDGTGGSSAAYVEPQDDYAPAGRLFIAVKNDYNGRECVRYPAASAPGADQLEYYSFEDSIYALYDVIYRDNAANVIELNQKTALYLDGVNGSNSNNGATPETAFKTLKRLYEYIAQQQAAGGITSKGVAVYIVNTVTLDGSSDQNVVLNNIQKKDPVTGEKYYEGYYQDDSTPRIEVDGQVYFKRYAQPKTYDAADSYYTGYGRETLMKELFSVKGGAQLTLWGTYLDGHSQEAASNNKLYAADGVNAMAPLITVADGGYLDCQYAEGTGNNIATSTLFLNNVNVNKKTNVVGQLNGSDIYEGSSAGIELLEGGKCRLNHAEFRNLYLGDNVISGGTDIYHNGEELHFYNKTLFSGTVFLEGQGIAGKEETFKTSRFLYVDEYGTPAQNDFQVLMRDPYKHRTVVHYVPKGVGPVSSQIGAFRLEERVKEFFYLTKKTDEPWILELLVPSAVYIDGVHGDDDLNNPESGSNPAHPVRTLKRAYELLKTRAGNTISVVGTIEIDQNTSITGTQYVGTDGTVSLGSTDKVHFVRYIQPDFARDGSETADAVKTQGFDVDDFTGVLMNVKGGNKLTVGNNVYFDGHSQKSDNIDFPKEIIVTRETTSRAPLMTVENAAVVELMGGSVLHDNNNIYDSSDGAADGTEGGAVNNHGTVSVSGAVFDNNHAKKGDAAYQAGEFTIQAGVANLEGHSFYLAADNRGTEANPDWEDYVLSVAEAIPDGQTFDMDMDHAAAGRDVIVFTSSDAYAPKTGADAEHEHFVLGSTVSPELFLVEAENDPAVLELQDWKTLHVEVPANIYLAVTRKGNYEGSTGLKAVLDGSADLFGSPEYEIVNNGRYDVKVTVNGMDNLNASAGITDDVMSLKPDADSVAGEKDLYLAVKGLDTNTSDGLTAAETALTDGTTAPFELGHLKAGSTGTFGLSGKVGFGFVDKYKDLAFPLTDTAEDVQKYMDGSGADGTVHACAKYLLKYKVQLVPLRR